MTIIKFDHPILRSKIDFVVDVQKALTKYRLCMIEDMITTMSNARGIGLAANQIGWEFPVFVIGVNSEPKVFINPKILEHSEESTLEFEGCLSFPDVGFEVSRSQKILVNYYDINGIKHTEEFNGLHARVIQHETDHLNGKYFFDRISEVDKEILIKKYWENQLI